MTNEKRPARSGKTASVQQESEPDPDEWEVEVGQRTNSDGDQRLPNYEERQADATVGSP